MANLIEVSIVYNAGQVDDKIIALDMYMKCDARNQVLNLDLPEGGVKQIALSSVKAWIVHAVQE